MEQGLRLINQIIERDAKSATYKLALLRGIIDIIQNHGNLKRKVRKPAKGVPEKHRRHSFEEYVRYPFGLLLEKWIFYYFPLADTVQTTSASQRLNFQDELDALVQYYQKAGADGFNAFFLDYKKGIEDDELKKTCFRLARKIRATLKDQPMCYMGNSYCKGHYQVCFPEDLPAASAYRDKECGKFDTYLLSTGYFGYFCIPAMMEETLELLGGYIFGTSTILRKWVSEMLRYSQPAHIDTGEHQLYKKLLPGEPERLVKEVQDYIKGRLEGRGDLYCILSGKPIREAGKLHIDHLIPFSVLGNNDIWNLLPALSAVNGKKSDRIPDPHFLERQKDLILEQWHHYHHHFHPRFEREVLTALSPADAATFRPEESFGQLRERCRYLIEARGFAPFPG